MNHNLPKTYRKQIIEGVSIPGLIRNWNHYFTDLEIYEDGRVECWNFQDFAHFKKDVHRGWVAVNIPDGERISIHSLGEWTINKGAWQHNEASFIDYVWLIVQHLNPKLVNLYEYHEKKVNGITVGESGKGYIYKAHKRSPNDPFPGRKTGKGLNLFFMDLQNVYHLVRLDIFGEDSILVNRYSEPFEIDLPQLEQMISKGQIVTELPVGAEVKILGLGKFTILEESYSTEVGEKLLEIKDMIKTLAGEPTSLEICVDVYDQYLKAPTKALKEALKVAYENIPEHEKMYVGDMDVKDTAVRMIIYGDEEIENWSHYQAAKHFGKELPTISIPKPLDE